MPQTDIFTIGKDNCKLQKLNHENILKILEYSESSQNYMKLTYEDLIKAFYDSDEFKDFKDYIKSKFYEYGFEKQNKPQKNKKVSLLNDYGLIKIFKKK